MTYVVIRNGLVIHCVSVNDVEQLRECYPDCILMERTGEEDIGWTFDGTNFTQG